MMNLCPVCGYDQLVYPPYPSFNGSYEICQCCGFQFGVTDGDSHISFESWRTSWIENGMPWRSNPKYEPDNWNPEKQLENLNHNPDYPTPIELPLEKIAPFAGTYIAEGPVRFTEVIELRGESLGVTEKNGTFTRLMPLNEHTFFIPGQRMKRSFIKMPNESHIVLVLTCDDRTKLYKRAT